MHPISSCFGLLRGRAHRLPSSFALELVCRFEGCDETSDTSLQCSVVVGAGGDRPRGGDSQESHTRVSGLAFMFEWRVFGSLRSGSHPDDDHHQVPMQTPNSG